MCQRQTGCCWPCPLQIILLMDGEVAALMRSCARRAGADAAGGAQAAVGGVASRV